MKSKKNISLQHNIKMRWQAFDKFARKLFCLYLCGPESRKNASVAELVDALDSKSCSFGSAGSIPARGTKALDFSRAFFILLLLKRYFT